MPISIDSQKRRRLLSVALVITLPLTVATCGSSPTAPPAPGNSGAEPPLPFITTIRIGTSALVLNGLGETGQLTVEAFLSNGTSLDRTAEAQWTSQDPGLATVGPAGLVTAVGIGATRIDAVFDGKRSTVDVLITPPGTFAAVGVVREPGRGPLAGVLVQETISSRSTRTDRDGQFGFAALQQARLRVAEDGFETVEIDATRPSGSAEPRLSFDIRLQRIARVTAGASRTQFTIAGDDVSYGTGFGVCQPCKLIRVATGKTGTLRVIVDLPGTPIDYYVWIDGRRFAFSGGSTTADAAVTASGETLVYVGRLLSYYNDFVDGPQVNFGIATSIDE